MGGSENGDVFDDRDLPPLTGPQLQAMRIDMLERRVASLEARILHASFLDQQAWEQNMLQHRLLSVDRLADAGLITREHAERRKLQLQREAQVEHVEVQL